MNENGDENENETKKDYYHNHVPYYRKSNHIIKLLHVFTKSFFLLFEDSFSLILINFC